MPPPKITPKAEETGRRILDSALELFRQEGFDTTTMRDIARKADVATGAAYYYYPSKDAIVMDFYRRSCAEMQPKIEAALEGAAGLEKRLRELIRVKLEHFAPNRGVLRALLRNGADPKHPLSPFSPQTKEIRDIDLAWFRRILVDCGMRIPRDLEPRLPGVLWFFQMGVIFFWVIDESPDQTRTDAPAGTGHEERGVSDPGVRAAPDAALAKDGSAVDRNRGRRSGMSATRARHCRAAASRHPRVWGNRTAPQRDLRLDDFHCRSGAAGRSRSVGGSSGNGAGGRSGRGAGDGACAVLVPDRRIGRGVLHR